MHLGYSNSQIITEWHDIAYLQMHLFLYIVFVNYIPVIARRYYERFKWAFDSLYAALIWLAYGNEMWTKKC